MTKTIQLHVLRVFANEMGAFGNPVGIVVDEKLEISPADRQTIATKAGFSESVFINKVSTGEVSIFNPQHEVKFAGHALVGTAYFINQVLNQPVSFLDCKGGHIQTSQDNDLTWISASLTGTPPWNHKELQSPSLVENLSRGQIAAFEHTVVWAWVDKDKGIIRARTFAPDWGISEDEANGSGSMQLAMMANRSVEIRHGKGSVIYAKPTGEGIADVGGRVAQSETREIPMEKLYENEIVKT